MAGIEERLAALEARVFGAHAAPEPSAFWALDQLRERVEAPGAVLFTGAVDVPTGEHYEWQHGTPVARLLDEDWTDLAPAIAALGHPMRLRLLREVLGGRRTTAELADVEGLGTSGQLYHHLRQLTAAGWLRPAASRGHYGIPPERIVPLLVILAAARR
ncbi:helix-turn-helix domain-containing protein [Dactylosporangium fulvum]|uniref:Helix-turn-helix domain-containing protein n=1 Tax=Dactylosporangium fulvum TaxID=53359 RepID=A0ABY5VT48_9ACTN|nr:helix-turn-helix domain-containing protein [Dactylosporangium fulvum]UWP80933.1 helix-turn-helix domain-containing protein [Dactylosporangium fulvum]